MILQLITRWLARQSPARQMAIRECNRRIGLARYHARRAMERAATIEQADWREATHAHKTDCGFPLFADYGTRGPGYLPAIVWKTLPYLDLRRAL